MVLFRDSYKNFKCMSHARQLLHVCFYPEMCLTQSPLCKEIWHLGDSLYLKEIISMLVCYILSISFKMTFITPRILNKREERVFSIRPDLEPLSAYERYFFCGDCSIRFLISWRRISISKLFIRTLQGKTCIFFSQKKVDIILFVAKIRGPSLSSHEQSNCVRITEVKPTFIPN